MLACHFRYSFVKKKKKNHYIIEKHYILKHRQNSYLVLYQVFLIYLNPCLFMCKSSFLNHFSLEYSHSHILNSSDM